MTAGDGKDSDLARVVAYRLRLRRRLVDYSFLRDTGSTPEDAGTRLGWGERTVEQNELRYRAREVPEWPPPAGADAPKTAWGDACGTELGWEVHRYLNRDRACPACLLAHYPGLLAEDTPAGISPPPPPPPVTDEEAARHLADLATAIGAPIPWDETSGQAAA
jgi:hypothetical protein